MHTVLSEYGHNDEIDRLAVKGVELDPVRNQEDPPINFSFERCKGLMTFKLMAESDSTVTRSGKLLPPDESMCPLREQV